MKACYFSKFIKNFKQKELPVVLTFYTFVIFKFCDVITALHWLEMTMNYLKKH